MTSRQQSWLVSVALLAILVCNAPLVRAAFPEIQTFENDADSYEPGSDPVNEPFSGSPPATGDWRNARNGGKGIIEEVSGGYLGVSAASGANYGVVYTANPEPDPVYAQGPHGFPAFSTTPLGVSWSYQTDIYADPAYASNNDGVPDWWWTNAVNRNGADEYLTETGFTGEVRSGGEWRFTTTLGDQPSVDLATGEWYTLEVEYELVGDEVHAHHRIFSDSRTVQLYEHTLTSLFQNPSASDVGGPRYSWFTYFEDNLDHLSVDNVGVDAPIEVLSGGEPGDLNADGRIDDSDEAEFAFALKNASSLTSAFGDIDGNGAVDNFDILAFNALIGAEPSSGSQASFAAAAVAVPEPSACCLALLGFVVCLLGRCLGVGRR